MFRKLFIFILLFGLLLPASAGAAKDYWAERFDVDLEIQPDGALVVTETVVFRFEGGPFTYYFRNGESWSYSILAGSEEWGRVGEPFRVANYEGNLYVWGVQRGNVLRYLSGRFGEFPEPWVQNDGGQQFARRLLLAPLDLTQIPEGHPGHGGDLAQRAPLLATGIPQDVTDLLSQQHHGSALLSLVVPAQRLGRSPRHRP